MGLFDKVFGNYSKKELAKIEPLLDKEASGKTAAVCAIDSNGQVTVRRPGDFITKMISYAGGTYAIEDAGQDESNSSVLTMNMGAELLHYGGLHAVSLNGDSLQDTCGVLGQISSITLENVGTLNGEDAEAVMEILMKKARLENAEALPGEQSLRITLKNGVQLEMSLSGDQLIGCGVWDCTEFLDAFRALVAERAGKQIV